MFELFGKVNLTKEYDSTGVGLGLTYCKKVIQHMNGEIFCDSKKEKGTTLRFYILVQCYMDD